MSLKDKDDEAEIKNLKIKIVEIEDKLNETLKGEAPYLNRVLEIIHNLKDEKNEEFRENIINGKIKPEELCTMNSVDMLSKNKQKRLKKKKKRKLMK